MKTLYIHLKVKYFNEIKSGKKVYEYRLKTDYWKRRLVGRDYDHVMFIAGYPRADDMSKRIIAPYRGYEEICIEHPEWNNEPQEVFAILTPNFL